jgi:small-conductance mechanosensitive channel
MVMLQVDPDLRAACGREPSWICETVFDATGNEFAAELSDKLVGTPGRILLILVVAWVLNLWVRRAIKRFLSRMLSSASSGKLSRWRRRAPSAVAESPVFSARAISRAETLGNVLRSMASVVIWSIALVTVLGELDVPLGPLVASAGIAGVALGFGAQSLVKDVITGMFMLMEDQYGVGDIVDLGEATGTVEAVTLRTTRVRDVEGTVWHVPNGTVVRVGNMSQQWARALLDVDVAYGTDIDQAKAVIEQTADALWQDPDWSDDILEEPEVWGLQQLAPDALQIRLVVKTKPGEQWRVSRELRARLVTAFTAEGIEIPFRQQTVWLRDDNSDS